MGTTPPNDDEDTHGICDDCARWIRLSEDQLYILLDRLQEHLRRRISKRTMTGAPIEHR